MSNINAPATVQYQMNHMAPATARGKIGDVLTELILRQNNSVNNSKQRMLTKAGLAINGGGAVFVKNTAAFAAVANGVLVRKAAGTAMATLAGTLATAKSALWAFYIDGAGALTVSAKTADAATHDAALLLMPALPSTAVTMIGFIIIDNATGSNFVGGTTALDTASLTVTYYDMEGAAPYLAGTTLGAMVDLESRAFP